MSFVNKSGEEVPLQLNGSMDSIITQLSSILPPGQTELAAKLGNIVYGEGRGCVGVVTEEEREGLKGMVTMDTGRLGMWIDPIGQLKMGGVQCN